MSGQKEAVAFGKRNRTFVTRKNGSHHVVWSLEEFNATPVWEWNCSLFALAPVPEQVVFFQDGRLVVRSLLTGVIVKSRAWGSSSSDVTSISVSKDENRIALSDSTGIVTVLEMEALTEVKRFELDQRIEQVGLNSDGSCLFCQSEDEFIWKNLEEGTTFEIPDTLQPSSTHFEKNGEHLVLNQFGRFGPTTAIWDISDSSSVEPKKIFTYSEAGDARLEGPPIIVGNALFARIGGRHDISFAEYSLESRQPLRSFRGLTAPVVKLAMTANDRYLAAGIGGVHFQWHSIVVWDLANGMESFRKDFQLDTVINEERPYHLLAVPASVERLDRDSVVTEFGDRLDYLLSNKFKCCAFSSSGKRLAGGGPFGNVVIWDDEGDFEALQPELDDLITAIAFSDENSLYATSRSGQVSRWQKQNGKWKFAKQFRLKKKLYAMAVANNQDEQVLVGGEMGAVFRCDFSEQANDPEEMNYWSKPGLDVYSLAISPSSPNQWAVGLSDGKCQIRDFDSQDQVLNLNGHADACLSAAYSSNGRVLFTGGYNGKTILWDTQTGKRLATLFCFRDGSWAVVDPSGRYDASNAGDIEGLHWVVQGVPVKLDQLKSRYYEPGLLSKILGFNDEKLQSVEKLKAPRLFPKVKTSLGPDGKSLDVIVKDQEGGIGRIAIFLNGKEVCADLRNLTEEESANLGSVELHSERRTVSAKVNISQHFLFASDTENRIEVYAFNEEQYLQSRGARIVAGQQKEDSESCGRFA